jgi:adenylate cyclase
MRRGGTWWRAGLTAAVVALALVLRFWPAMTLLDRMELRTLDWRFMHRGARAPHPDVIILAVDEASITKVGRWPWRRRVFAGIIDQLKQAGARAIVFDIFFSEPDLLDDGVRSDTDLAEATAEAGMVYHAAFGHAPEQPGEQREAVLPGHDWSGARVIPGTGLNAVAGLYDLGSITEPLPELMQGAAGVGFVNVADSGDGVFRESFPVATCQERLLPSLARVVAADLLGVSQEQVVVELGQRVRLGDKRVIPIDRNGRTLVDFAGGSGTYPYVSINEFLAMADSQPDAVAQQVEDKVVLVAVSAPGLYDLRACPFSAVFNGVETQANVIANVLEGRFLRQARGGLVALVMVVCGLVMYVGIIRLRAVGAVIYAALALLCYNWLCMWLFAARGYVMDMLAPNLVLVGSAAVLLSLRLFREQSEREQVRATLAKFVPPEIVEQAVQSEPEALLRGQRRVVTVMFADLRNYTAASGRMPPEEAVDLLNRFFLLAHEVIWEFGGTLDKYIGDCLMAFFNAPADQEDHALRAVQTAVEMQARIRTNRAEWEFLGMPELAAGVGISTGEAVVGYLGTGERMQYTAIGQDVNLAARLEPLNKEFGTEILISQATYDAVSDAVRVRPHGPVELRGFEQPMMVYEVLEITAPIAKRADGRLL